MHGEPGAGKSTLAKAIGRETGAVVLDKDILKSRILDGEPEGASTACRKRWRRRCTGR
jgi:predicted kinase